MVKEADLGGGEVDGLSGLHDRGWLLGYLGPGHWLLGTPGMLHLIDHLVGDLKKRDPVGQVGDVPHHSALLGCDSVILLGPQAQTLLLCLVCCVLQPHVKIGLVGQRTSPEEGQPNRHFTAIFILVRKIQVILKDVILEGRHRRMLRVEPEPRVDGGATGVLREVTTDEIKVETHAAQNFHLTSESCSK